MNRKKRKLEYQNDEEEYEVDRLPAHKMPVAHIREQEKRLIVILEGAQLETVSVSFS